MCEPSVNTSGPSAAFTSESVQVAVPYYRGTVSDLANMWRSRTTRPRARHIDGYPESRSSQLAATTEKVAQSAFSLKIRLAITVTRKPKTLCDYARLGIDCEPFRVQSQML